MNLNDALRLSVAFSLEQIGRSLFREESPDPVLPRSKSANHFEGVLTRPSGIRPSKNVDLIFAHRDASACPDFDLELKRWVDTHLAADPTLTTHTIIDVGARQEREQYFSEIANQFRKAYSTGSSSFALHGSTDHQIETLPACLSEMHALRDLTLTNLNISSLPQLPPYLTTLSITRCGLKSMAEIPRHVIALRLDYNELTTLPDLPYTLRALKARGNALRSLSKVPNAIGYIDVSNNMLENIEALILSTPRLRYLNLAFNRLTVDQVESIREQNGNALLDCNFANEKDIRTADDGIRRELRNARLWVSDASASENGDRRKAFAKIERVYAQFGDVLDLSCLNLSELPSSLIAISYIEEFRMDGNSLTPETHSYKRPAYSATGFSAQCWSDETIDTVRSALGWDKNRNTIYDAVVNASPNGVEIVNHWHLPADIDWVDHMEAWQTISQETNSQLFFSFLQRLPETFEYQQPEAQLDFIARVKNLLIDIRKSEQLRESCFSLATGIDEQSGLGIALMLNDMETARVRHDIEKKAYPLDELHQIGQGLFRLKVVEEEATKKITEMNLPENQKRLADTDAVSIRLRRHVKLAKRLGLPVAAGVGSQQFSEETDNDLLHIEHKIAELEQGNQYTQFFVKWPQWRVAIQDRNPDAFASIYSIIKRRADHLATRPARTSEEEWQRQIAAFRLQREAWLNAPITRLTRNYLCPESDSDD